MTDKYILINGQPVVEPDVIKWGRWFEAADDERIISKTIVNEARVSTVFLGIDHNFSTGGEPILWETMIFGGQHDGWQERYISREKAVERHLEIVIKLQAGESLE